MGVVYSLYDALVSINVPNDKAKAVIDAIEREMMDKVATKADLEYARDVISKDIRALEITTKADFDHAREATRALEVAYKADLEHVRDFLSKDIAALGVASKADLAHLREVVSKDIQHLSNAMTLRMILTAAALVPTIVAAQRYF
jgi:hypothetical protein